MLVSVLAASIAVSIVSACDTRTPGYWKNHLEAWPVAPGGTGTTFPDSFEGSRTYTIPANAMDILWMPVKGDAAINLKQKVIAAELSILADQRDGWGYPPNYVGGPMGGANLIDLVDAANAWLTAHPTAPPGTASREQGLALASAIDYWLNFYDVG